jgi:hypothetical protein
MALRADFEVINFWEHLGDKKGDINTSAKFVGDQSTVRSFYIGQRPLGAGFVTLQLFDIQNSGHHIKINGQELAGMDIPKHPAADRWLTWTDTIESGILRQGSNTIQIVRTSSGDNFIVRSVIVNWREVD